MWTKIRVDQGSLPAFYHLVNLANVTSIRLRPTELKLTYYDNGNDSVVETCVSRGDYELRVKKLHFKLLGETHG